MARSSFDRFLGTLQHLAVAKELILSKDAEKARMAVILLDSLADGLMFRERSMPGMLHRVLVFRGAFAWETEAIGS